MVHVLTALFPRPLFAHHRTYKNFTVHMREVIPDDITYVIDRVDALLSGSVLGDPSVHHTIYIFNNRRLVRFLLLRDVHFGANLPNGTTFIVDADVSRDVARCRRIGHLDQRRRTLSESIAHEIAHRLIRRHLGWRAERRLPSWIREGYCEYVAQGAVIEERTGLSLLGDWRGHSVPGFAQFRNRLMMEYLLNEQKRPLDEVFGDPPDFEEVHRLLVAALKRDGTGLLERLRARGEVENRNTGSAG